jgi:hypothetical protein
MDTIQNTGGLTRLARSRRVLASALTLSALAAGAGLAAFAVDAGSAGAAATANLGITQSISGSSTSGSTIDTVKVTNAGPSTATGVSALLYMKSSISSYVVHNSGGTCEVSPAPAGFTIAVDSCQLGSIASGASATVVFTVSGTAGTAFTTTASVGSLVADPSWTNNISNVSSYFGPRADLSLAQTAAVGATKGTATVVDTVTNNGPNTGNALQLVQEIKSAGYASVHATSNVSASCQMIPAASGYNRAFACTTNSLAKGATWKVTLAYTGTAGTALQVDSKVTANNPIDPVTSNNSKSSSTTYHA